MTPIEFRRVTLFAAMPRKTVAEMAIASRWQGYRSGVLVFRTGDPCLGITVVLDGFVRLFRLTGDGTEITTGIVPPGGLLAVAALRGECRHDDHAEALGYVRTVEIPIATVVAIGIRLPALLATIARALIDRIDRTFAAAVAWAGPCMSARVVHILRSLAAVAQTRGHGPSTQGVIHRLGVRLSHKDLARLVGSDRETVTRALRTLEAKGIIRRERGHITGVALGAVGVSLAGPTGASLAPDAA